MKLLICTLLASGLLAAQAAPAISPALTDTERLMLLELRVKSADLALQISQIQHAQNALPTLQNRLQRLRDEQVQVFEAIKTKYARRGLLVDDKGVVTVKPKAVPLPAVVPPGTSGATQVAR